MGFLFTPQVLVLKADAMAIPLQDKSVQCVVTSPPYWGLRSYLPDMVRLKDDAPAWVVKELESLDIYPENHEE